MVHVGLAQTALGPALRAEPPRVLTLPSLERAEGSAVWSYPQRRTLVELLIDWEEERTLRAV